MKKANNQYKKVPLQLRVLKRLKKRREEFERDNAELAQVREVGENERALPVESV